MLVEVLGLLRHAVLLYVVGGGIEMHLDTDEVTLDQIRLPGRRHANRDIGFAHRQIELGIVDHQADLDLGVEIEKFPNPRCQPRRAEGDRSLDLERTLGSVLRFGDQTFSHRQFGKYVACRAKEEFALLGQNQATRMAVKQRDAQAFLKRADLPAYRRLAEIQRFPGMRETSRLCHRMEYPQLVPIHCHFPWSAPTEPATRPLFGRARIHGFLLCREELFRLERSHTAHSGSRNRLTKDLVLDVARGKHSRDCGLRRIRAANDIALRIERELPGKKARNRGMSDRNKNAVAGKLPHRTAAQIA